MYTPHSYTYTLVSLYSEDGGSMFFFPATAIHPHRDGILISMTVDRQSMGECID